MRARVIPRVGQTVMISFLAVKVHGIVERVDPDQLGLEVVTEEGEAIRFQLSRITGRFMSEAQTGARLYFEND